MNVVAVEKLSKENVRDHSIGLKCLNLNGQLSLILVCSQVRDTVSAKEVISTK